MKRNFGHHPKSDVEPAELTAGGLYAIFVATVLVLWLAFIHP